MNLNVNKIIYYLEQARDHYISEPDSPEYKQCEQDLWHAREFKKVVDRYSESASNYVPSLYYGCWFAAPSPQEERD